MKPNTWWVVVAVVLGLAGVAQAGRFIASTDEMTFPDTQLGAQSTERVRLENITDDEVDVTIAIDDDMFWTGSLVLTLPARGQGFIDVTFWPVEGGWQRSYMRLTTEIDADYIALPLIGSGTLPAVEPQTHEDRCGPTFHCSTSGGAPGASWAVIVAATWYAARHGRGRKRRR